MHPSFPTAPTTAAPKSSSASIPLFAMLLGIVLIFGVGFASPLTLHNAAHDARHAFAFPCH